MSDIHELNAESIYSRFTTGTPQLSVPYDVARLAVYESEKNPEGLTSALVCLLEENGAGTLRPPIPRVLARYMGQFVAASERGESDVINNDDDRASARALLDVATRFEILRFATDPSSQESASIRRADILRKKIPAKRPSPSVRHHTVKVRPNSPVIPGAVKREAN